MLLVSDITDNIRFTDQIYGRGLKDAPILSFPRKKGSRTGYNSTALKLIDWKSDYIAQYVPLSSPYPQAAQQRGRIVSLVSIYPKEGRTNDYVREGTWDADALERWPDAIMIREVFLLENPPELRSIYTDHARLTSSARGILGHPTPELYEGLRNEPVRPLLDLYRSAAALEYLRYVEDTASMQIVANRRTGRAGYVYALALPEYPGKLKIGSAFEVSIRIAGLGTAVPVDFECVGSVFSEDCRTTEREVHQALAGYRIRSDREWFECNIDQFNETAARLTVGPDRSGRPQT